MEDSALVLACLILYSVAIASYFLKTDKFICSNIKLCLSLIQYTDSIDNVALLTILIVTAIVGNIDQVQGCINIQKECNYIFEVRKESR